MKCILLRQVRYRLPATDRLVWAVVIAEAEGLTLLYVRKPDPNRQDSLIVAVEDVKNGFHEDARGSRFPVGGSELAKIGAKLQALGGDVEEGELAESFEPEDLF
jgi:hypothetical protein